MSDAQSDTPGFLTGLLLGGLMGVTVAMIVAPEAGSDSADVAQAKAQQAADGVREAAADLRDTAQASAYEVSQQASELLVRGRRIVEAARARFDASVAEGKAEAAHHRITLESGS